MDNLTRAIFYLCTTALSSQILAQEAFDEREPSFSSFYKNDSIAALDNSSHEEDEPQKFTKFRPSENQAYWQADASLIYWRTLENNLDYAIANQPLPPVSTETSAIGQYQTATFSWDVGFKAGLSKRFSSRLWEFQAQYTHFHNHGYDQIYAPPNATSQLIVATFPDALDARLGTATSHLMFNLNSLDLLLAHSWALHESIRLRFTAGVAAQWLKQDWTIQYEAQDTTKDQTLKQQMKFSGAGPEFGCEIEWYLGAGLGILTKLSTAVPVGSYDYTNSSRLESNTLIDAKEHLARPLPNVQLFLGPRFGQKLKNVYLDLFAGYEILSIVNFQQIDRSTLTSGVTTDRLSHFSTGQITFQGLTVQLGLTY